MYPLQEEGTAGLGDIESWFLGPYQTPIENNPTLFTVIVFQEKLNWSYQNSVCMGVKNGNSLRSCKQQRSIFLDLVLAGRPENFH